ncbi:GNAT family N-acetyltransferase [Niallia sp. 03190]|uniref:GNAT family N-acetyltransferase n=1 Tax=Niallia sp. 03190 TaxID=3458061 RepID=UPI00404499C3
MMNLNVIQITTVDPYLKELTKLLINVVDQGASIGFLAPLDEKEALYYWETVQKNPDILLWIVKEQQSVIATVQLHLNNKQNGKHRAEIAKLMVVPSYQKKGIGKMLLQVVEEAAEKNDRQLLVLDTREGDPSNKLYQSFGFIEAGKIPKYALSSDGNLSATVFYYKWLKEEQLIVPV